LETLPADPRTYDGVDHIFLIGGEDIMVRCASLARGQGWPVTAIVAPRHAEQTLPISGDNQIDALKEVGADTHTVEDINHWPEFPALTAAASHALALCFGPAWIFSQDVMARFGAGMINFNGIPVPRYLGGAHYTWQIMNGDRTGACVLQEITAHVDHGAILRRRDFVHPPAVRIPQGYFESNYDEGTAFLAEVLAEMKAGKPFEPVPFESIDSGRVYFPRLFTVENGHIDWSWTAHEIERFCCAFDRPYPGAATEIDKTLVRLSDVRVEPLEGGTHPFANGLVVRRRPDEAWIAAQDGILVVGKASFEDGSDAMAMLKEGRRLMTPTAQLDHARAFRPVLKS